MKRQLSRVAIATVLALASLPSASAEHRRLLRAGNGTAAATRSLAPEADAREPRIYFLFLAMDKVSNLAVWNAFFTNQPAEKYRAYVHCKLPSCVAQVAGSFLVPVPTVPSYYCTDLVSPMNQLLSFALNTDMGPSSPLDKFAFISDSALPAKPFSEIYATLGKRTGSDFCVFPPNEWADLPGNDGMEVAVKFHQWITLSRAHAEKAWGLWSSGYLHRFMAQFKLNSLKWNVNNNSFADHRNWGCLDEFWHMAALFGTLRGVDASKESVVKLEGFEGGPLKISKSAGWQGECDTFVIWAKYMHTLGSNKFENFFVSLDKVSVPHSGNWARPGWWDTISPAGISAIRKSDFLFVRKFIDNPTLAGGGDFHDAYTKLVLNV